MIVFLAAGMPPECGPTLDFLRTLLVALPLSIHVALRKFYLVHPTLMTRVSFALFGIALWGKLHFVDQLHHLREFFPPGHLLVPNAVVMEDERRLHLAGIHLGIHLPPTRRAAAAAVPAVATTPATSSTARVSPPPQTLLAPPLQPAPQPPLQPPPSQPPPSQPPPSQPPPSHPPPSHPLDAPLQPSSASHLLADTSVPLLPGPPAQLQAQLAPHPLAITPAALQRGLGGFGSGLGGGGLGDGDAKEEGGARGGGEGAGVARGECDGGGGEEGPEGGQERQAKQSMLLDVLLDGYEDPTPIPTPTPNPTPTPSAPFDGFEEPLIHLPEVEAIAKAPPATLTPAQVAFVADENDMEDEEDEVLYPRSDGQRV